MEIKSRVLVLLTSGLFGGVIIGGCHAIAGEVSVVPRTNVPGMVLVQGGELNHPGLDNKTAVRDLYVGINEVSNRDWNQVVEWSKGVNESGTKVGPVFTNFHPMTNRPIDEFNYYIDIDRPANALNNEDEIFMWCNLKSLREGLKPVYYKVQYNTNTKTFPPTIGNYYGFTNSTDRDPTSTGFMGPYMDPNANGYRVPLSSEWDWVDNAARKIPYLKYSSTDSLSRVATKPAASYGDFFSAKPDFFNSTKIANPLGIYDLYGSVKELCFDNNLFNAGIIKVWPWATNTTYTESIYGEYGHLGANAQIEFIPRLRKGGGYLYYNTNELTRGALDFGTIKYDANLRKDVRYDQGLSGKDFATWGFRLFRNADPVVSLSTPTLPKVPLSYTGDSKIHGRVQVLLRYAPGVNYMQPTNIVAYDDVVWVGVNDYYEDYLALKRANGDVVLWYDDGYSFPQFEPTTTFSNTTVVGLGRAWVIGARSDGSLWSAASPWLVDAPASSVIPQSLGWANASREFVDIVTTPNYTLCLKADGLLEAWGSNTPEIQTMLSNALGKYPQPPGETRPRVVDIDGESSFIALLLENGGVELHALNETVASNLGAFPVSQYASKQYPLGSTTNRVVAIATEEQSILTLFENNSLRVSGSQEGSAGVPTGFSNKVVGVSASLPQTYQVVFDNGRTISWGNWSRTNTFSNLLQSEIHRNFSVNLVADGAKLSQMAKEKDSTVSQIKINPRPYGLWTQSDAYSHGNERWVAGNTSGIETGQRNVLTNPSAFNLYTSNSIHNLKMGGVMLQKDALGKANLRLRLMESTNLSTWSLKDEIIWQADLPQGKAFLRVLQGE
jgi:formylglycine-generating enzyme required for sulfatase activity